MSEFTLKKDIQDIYKRSLRDEIDFFGYVIRTKDGETEFHMTGQGRALDVMYAFNRMAADVGEMVYATPEELLEEEEGYDGTSH